MAPFKGELGSHHRAKQCEPRTHDISLPDNARDYVLDSSPSFSTTAGILVIFFSSAM